ncbi:MAG: hypothetical protein WBY53_13820 [Acidobacteriaceae bacterium]
MNLHPSQSRRRTTFILFTTIALSATCAFAQTAHKARAAICTPPPNPLTETPPPTHPPLLPCPVKHHTDTSISLGIFPQLTIDRTAELTGFSEQGTAPSTGTLGTFRQTFNSWLGYSVNLGYARVSEQYRNQPNYSGPSNFNINSNMYESSLTYVAHTSVNKRISLFADLGPGLLTFLPVPGAQDPFSNPVGSRGLSVQVRPAGVFGSGIDLHLTRHFDLRAEYRGLVYKNPDFQTGDTLSKQLTLTSEPTISVVYHFHPTKPWTP